MSCTTCSTKFASNSLRISCSRCPASYHKKCSQLSETEWKRYLDPANFFVCKNCKTRRRSSILGDVSTKETNDASTELSVLRSDISTLKANLSLVMTTNAEVEKSLTNVHDSMTAIELNLCKLEKRLEVVDDLVEENTRLKNQIMVINNRLDKLELKPQTKQRHEEKDKQSEFKVTINGIERVDDENTCQVVANLCSRLEAPVIDSVVRCNRVENKKTKSSFIMVTMRDRLSMETLVKAARKKRPTTNDDKNTAIYVNERLSQTCYNLLKKARKLHHDHGFRWVWATNDTVLAQKEVKSKIYKIRSEHDIGKIINENKEALSIVNETDGVATNVD